jgi:hypothetical protein
MEEFECWRIERACTALSVDFARALDFSDQDHFLELFTIDAELEYDASYLGIEAIARFVGTRPRALRTRHVMSNTAIEVLDADVARGLAYCTLHAGAPGTAPVTVAVGHAQDRFRRTGDGWRFERRTFHWSFGSPPG